MSKLQCIKMDKNQYKQAQSQLQVMKEKEQLFSKNKRIISIIKLTKIQEKDDIFYIKYIQMYENWVYINMD